MINTYISASESGRELSPESLSVMKLPPKGLSHPNPKGPKAAGTSIGEGPLQR